MVRHDSGSSTASAGTRTERGPGAHARQTWSTAITEVLPNRVIKEAMGAFNKPESSAPYLHLINRIEAVSADKRYDFMFSRLTVHDNMAQVLSRILRIPVDGKVESRIEDAERSRTEEEIRVLMAPLLRSLPAEDRLLLKLYYWDGLSMAAISPLLGRPQRELYTVRDKCLKKIRRNLEEAGLSPERIRALLGCSHPEVAEEV